MLFSKGEAALSDGRLGGGRWGDVKAWESRREAAVTASVSVATPNIFAVTVADEGIRHPLFLSGLISSWEKLSRAFLNRSFLSDKSFCLE